MLEHVLLIDDDFSTLFMHQAFIHLFDENIKVNKLTRIEEAFEFLEKSKLNNEFPDFIFVDVNFSQKGGFDFLELYQESGLHLTQPNTKVFMLSGNYYGKIIEKLDQYSWVAGFVEKPLTDSRLKELIDQHFMKDSQSAFEFYI